jgi:hypothetical protein
VEGEDGRVVRDLQAEGGSTRGELERREQEGGGTGERMNRARVRNGRKRTFSETNWKPAS